MKRLHVLASMSLALVLAACAPSPDSQSRTVQAREISYVEVPADRTEAIHDALDQLLAQDERGSASVAGPGQILLSTDPQTRSYIEASLERMIAANPLPRRDPSHRVHLQIWALQAGQGLEDLTAAPVELQPALAAFPKLDWRQLETIVHTRAVDGRPGSLRGGALSVTSTLFRQQDGYLANLTLMSTVPGTAGRAADFRNAHAELLMKPGELVLLTFREADSAAEALVVRVLPAATESEQ